MKSLILYDKKEGKIKSDKISEYDLDELESLMMYRHGEEFLKIPESKIGKHTILESFALNDISWWWFAAPTIHPKYKDAMLFIDRLNILLDENSFEVLKLKGCFNKLEIIQKICKNKKIKLEVSKNEYYIYSKTLQLKNLIKKKCI